MCNCTSNNNDYSKLTANTGIAMLDTTSMDMRDGFRTTAGLPTT